MRLDAPDAIARERPVCAMLLHAHSLLTFSK
jgi:hypothetical protein